MVRYTNCSINDWTSVLHEHQKRVVSAPARGVETPSFSSLNQSSGSLHATGPSVGEVRRELLSTRLSSQVAHAPHFELHARPGVEEGGATFSHCHHLNPDKAQAEGHRGCSGARGTYR